MDQLLSWFKQIYNVQGIVTTGGLIALVAIVFAETGLLIGFFLPGDSLLVTAGIFCTSANPTGRPLLDILHVNIFVSLAAIAGDTVGYWIGLKSGPRLFSRKNSLFFSQSHLQRTKEFYERHGGKTIIIARFMPIIRTFAPVVAGVGQMNYRRFLSYNVFGGIFWVTSMTWLGYGIAEWARSRNIDITKRIDKLIILIIFLSLLPGMIGWLRGWLKNRNAQTAR